MPDVWTVQKVLQWTIRHFTEKSVPEPRLGAELLLAHVLDCQRIDLYLQFDRILTKTELAAYREAIKRRSRFEPVQYIIGEQEFMGLTFRVTPDVLIPRPETELLVDQIMADFRDRKEVPLRVLDVGCGSGVIGVSLAHFAPAWQVTAIDISEKALAVARGNADRLKTANISFRQADALQFRADDRFDLIAANPPYVAEKERETLHAQVKNYEPAEALFAGPDGFAFLNGFLPRLTELLAPGGCAYLEIGYDQSEKINKLFHRSGINNVRFIQDFQGINRIVQVRL